MPYPYAFSTVLAQPGASAGTQDLWLPEPDPASVARLQARRARILQACTAACAGLAPHHPGLQDLAELLEQDGAAGPDPAAQALARYQRYLNLSCTRPYGRIGLQLFDTQAWLELTLDDPGQWATQRRALQQDLAALLGALAHADGLQPILADSPASATAQADAVLDAQAPRVARHARQVQKVARQARLGRPAVVLMGLVMVALTLWLVLDAHRVGTLARLTDANRPLPFINDRLEEVQAGWGLFPVFVLRGHVRTDDTPPAVVEATVQVHRNVALRTGNGARYTVLPTRDPARPYVLRNEHDDVGTVLALGRHGLHWTAVFALLPLPLWYAGMARPWRAAARGAAGLQPHRRYLLVKTWGSVLLWGAAMLALAFLSHRFG